MFSLESEKHADPSVSPENVFLRGEWTYTKLSPVSETGRRKGASEGAAVKIGKVKEEEKEEGGSSESVSKVLAEMAGR